MELEEEVVVVEEEDLEEEGEEEESGAARCQPGSAKGSENPALCHSRHSRRGSRVVL